MYPDGYECTEAGIADDCTVRLECAENGGSSEWAADPILLEQGEPGSLLEFRDPAAMSICMQSAPYITCDSCIPTQCVLEPHKYHQL